ncbi:MAG: carbamoyltransferase, partial [Proteobacteria bacterium]|nr:carbamoyltransferase [Pseudomonadota bacterium]
MIVIGLNAFHGDSSACLLKDGQLVAAVEEERFTRIKHWAGFPALSIAYCLREAGLQLQDVDVVAVNSDARAARFEKMRFLLSGRAGLALIKEKILVRKKRASVRMHIEKAFPDESFNGRIEYVEHHLAHMASSYLCSEFEEALVLSIDGFGDFSSCAWGIGSDSAIDVLGRVYFPHSLGIFYQAMTQFLGFHHYGDEYKVMGLASYGKPDHIGQFEKILCSDDDGKFELNLDYFNHHRSPAGFEWADGSPKVSQLYTSALEHLLGVAREPNSELGQRHFDLAHAIQITYERAFFKLLESAIGKTAYTAAALSGGCAMNSVANGKIYRETSIEKLYVQAAAGDAGGAVGAALISSQRNDQAFKRRPIMRADLGPAYTDVQIQSALTPYLKVFEEQ